MTFVPVPGYMPTYNPPLPCRKPVPYGLHPGMSIYILGMIPHSTSSFRVNFSRGDDILLHFNPRFKGQDVVVLNTFQGGSWGSEEYHGMPLKLGEFFEIIFVVTNDHFQISVNRNHFCDYKHRMPVNQIQEVNVDGDMELQSLIVLGGGMMGVGGMMPIPGGPGGSAGGYLMMTAPASCNPPVPYKGNFPGGLCSKKTVVVRGYIPQHAKGFWINFRAGHSDIALHINPRLNEQSVVRNSLLGGAWGCEERDLPFNPFQPGKYFDLSIRCGNERFKIFANGQPLFNYSHRFHNFQQIDTLDIDGDVILTFVQF